MRTDFSARESVSRYLIDDYIRAVHDPISKRNNDVSNCNVIARKPRFSRATFNSAIEFTAPQVIQSRLEFAATIDAQCASVSDQ